MRLAYPPLLRTPRITVGIHSNGQDVFYPMLVDTGADYTCFPASYAATIGHNNLDARVETTASAGVGGLTRAFHHTLSVSLLDPAPTGEEGLAERGAPPSVWTSRQHSFRFLESFDTNFGLLGRDLMAEWKLVTFLATRKRWAIVIEI